MEQFTVSNVTVRNVLVFRALPRGELYDSIRSKITDWLLLIGLHVGDGDAPLGVCPGHRRRSLDKDLRHQRRRSRPQDAGWRSERGRQA